MGKVEVEGKVNLCVFRCEPQNGRLEESVGAKRTWDVSVLERHEFSSQAFVPMGGGGDRYLVIVAENDKRKSGCLPRLVSDAEGFDFCSDRQT